MSQELIEKRVKTVMSRVFSMDEGAIDEKSSPDTIEAWDSLGHMNLVVALEEEFGVELSDDQTVDILSYPILLATIKEVFKN